MKKPQPKTPNAVSPEATLAKTTPKNIFFTGTQLYRRRDLPTVLPFLGRTAINKLIAAGNFPEPITLPNGVKVWPDHRIQAWIVECELKSEGRAGSTVVRA